LGDCFLDLLVHALQDLFRRKWTELSLRIHRVANLERAHALNELLKEALVNFIRDNESLRCDTGLTGVDRACFDRSAQRRFEVCACITMNASLPPNSSTLFLISRAAALATAAPAFSLPVTVTAFTRASTISFST